MQFYLPVVTCGAITLLPTDNRSALSEEGYWEYDKSVIY